MDDQHARDAIAGPRAASGIDTVSECVLALSPAFAGLPRVPAAGLRGPGLNAPAFANAIGIGSKRRHEEIRIRPGARITAGVRKNSACRSADPPTCGILPHSGNHAEACFGLDEIRSQQHKRRHSKWGAASAVCAVLLIAGASALATTPAWAQQPAKTQDPRGALFLLLLVPLALAAFTALQFVLWVLAPAPLEATCRAIERARGRCLLVGLGAAAVTLVLLTLLGQRPAIGKSAAPVLLGVVALGCLAGITAVTALLGRGVVELADWSGSRALAILLGSILLGFGVLFPIVGQVLGAYFLLLGLGGALVALTGSTHGKK